MCLHLGHDLFDVSTGWLLWVGADCLPAEGTCDAAGLLTYLLGLCLRTVPTSTDCFSCNWLCSKGCCFLIISVSLAMLTVFPKSSSNLSVAFQTRSHLSVLPWYDPWSFHYWGHCTRNAWPLMNASRHRFACAYCKHSQKPCASILDVLKGHYKSLIAKYLARIKGSITINPIILSHTYIMI